MYTVVLYKSKRYKVEGCKRSGFSVYAYEHKYSHFIGRSIADTAYKAVIDALRNQYSAYY